MFDSTQALTHIKLQDEMNTKVDPNWISTANPFLRAAAVEAFEALDHWMEVVAASRAEHASISIGVSRYLAFRFVAHDT